MKIDRKRKLYGEKLFSLDNYQITYLDFIWLDQYFSWKKEYINWPKELYSC